MYIKLTRADGDPIWINASFIVTIEPHKRSGGSIVVPVGDGLDYEVRESPAAVLAMLEGAPAPAIVPVPTSDALSSTPFEQAVSGDGTGAEQANDPLPEEPKPAKKATKRTKAKTAKKNGEESDQPEAEAPKKKAAAKTRAKKKEPLNLEPGELERLRKLAPKSLKKLHNTISTQFKTISAKETVDALKDHDIIKLDGDHVIWADPT